MGVQFMMIWVLLVGLISFAVYRASAVEAVEIEANEAEDEDETSQEYWRCLGSGGC